MKRFNPLLLLFGLLILAGCAGMKTSPPGYREIDLKRDLSEQTLARFRAEEQQATTTGTDCHMATLEKTDWWPLGLIAFWHRGTVQTMHKQGGETYYMVSRTRGYGPLSLIYVEKEDATFDAEGKRLTGMRARSVLMGCLAMSHEMESRLNSEDWMSHKTFHLIHHVINISEMDGMMEVSLLTAPNPISYGN